MIAPLARDARRPADGRAPGARRARAGPGARKSLVASTTALHPTARRYPPPEGATSVIATGPVIPSLRGISVSKSGPLTPRSFGRLKLPLDDDGTAGHLPCRAGWPAPGGGVAAAGAGATTVGLRGAAGVWSAPAALTIRME